MSRFQLIQAAPLKIILPVLITLSLFVVTFFGLILPSVEGHLMARKREMIRALTQVAWSTVHHYAELADKGAMSRSQAQQMAMAQLRNMRYGPQDKDYFWINDMHPRMVMHPYRSDLEGKDMSDVKDPTGNRLFVNFAATVRRKGGGYVDYQWQWMNNPHKIVDKISYVQGFAPWGWVIGTGLYVEDVQAQISALTHHMTLVCIGISLAIFLLSAYVIWQGAGVENRRRMVESSLRASEAQYRLLAEAAREIIVTFDDQRHITYANPAWLRISGYTAAEMSVMLADEILAPNRRQDFNARLTRLAGAEPVDELFETELRKRSGASLEAEVTLAAMAPEGYLMAARDITEKKKTATQARLQQEQLFQSAKMASLGTLVSGVAHEINNPIAIVMLNVEVFAKFWAKAAPILDQYHQTHEDLAVGGMDYEELQQRMPKLLEHVKEGVARVKHIVGDLKEFAGQPSDVWEPVDLNRVVQKAVGLVNSLIKKATFDFQVQCAPALPAFRGNGQRIEQVAINLLVNACQAMRDKHLPIRLSTGYDARQHALFMKVQDSGCGIPADVLGRITDPFFTTKRDSGGTGLGLSISDTIMREHGGWLVFASQEGQGTLATAWIPVPHSGPNAGGNP